MGADAILLIVRLLDDAQLHHLYEQAQAYGLSALVEVHDEAEAQRANRLGARLVAINNRDLARFDTDAATASRVARQLAPGTIVVAASAISSVDEIRRNLADGISRFLVGEALVRSDDPAALLRRWCRATAADLRTQETDGPGGPALASITRSPSLDATCSPSRPSRPSRWKLPGGSIGPARPNDRQTRGTGLP